jgi:hypothetical protein
MRHVQCLFGLKRPLQIVSLASRGAEGASMHTLGVPFDPRHDLLLGCSFRRHRMLGHRFVQDYAFDQIKLALPGRLHERAWSPRSLLLGAMEAHCAASMCYTVHARSIRCRPVARRRSARRPLQWRNPVTSDTLPASARRLADAFGFDRNGHGCPPVRRVSGLGSLICRRQAMSTNAYWLMI